MAEEQSKKYEMIYDMGSGLIIAKVPLDGVKEQDINARIMKNEMQDQLTANIKNRGQLESLPFFCLVENQIEIISGHHRVKSARAAGMKEIIGVATYEQCKEFTETLSKYQKFSDIRNVGAAIHSMVQSVNEKMDNVGYDENEEWTYLAKLFGSNAIPGEAANVIQQAIKKAEKKGTITSKNRWQLIEFLCADYLSGK